MFGISYAINTPDFPNEYCMYLIGLDRYLSTVYDSDIGKWMEINDWKHTRSFVFFYFDLMLYFAIKIFCWFLCRTMCGLTLFFYRHSLSALDYFHLFCYIWEQEGEINSISMIGLHSIVGINFAELSDSVLHST